MESSSFVRPHTGSRTLSEHTGGLRFSVFPKKGTLPRDGTLTAHQLTPFLPEGGPLIKSPAEDLPQDAQHNKSSAKDEDS